MLQEVLGLPVGSGAEVGFADGSLNLRSRYGTDVGRRDFGIVTLQLFEVFEFEFVVGF